MTNINTDDMVDDTIDRQEILKFVDGAPGHSTAMAGGLDPETSTTFQNDDAGLKEFFARPIRIFTITWNVGTALSLNIDPWDRFWTNPRNINRINNFRLMRCKLNLDFKINGNAFHYGRVLCSYTPLAGTVRFDDMTQLRNSVPQDLIARSQRPHIFLDPTTNSGGLMELPYFYLRNYLDITTSEWQSMGSLSVDSLQDLQHANSGTDPITIQIYAYATELELGLPTSVNSTSLVPQSNPEYELVYEPQSGKGQGSKPKNKSKKKNNNKKQDLSNSNTNGDEYENDGLISRPASMVAKVAGYLQNIPVLAPYAKATEIAASGVAGIARIFGYSRPVQLEPPTFSRWIPIGNMANTNMIDNSTKLALDAKQELTIDPRTVGLDGTDEMAIKSLVTRESYITQFPWTMVDGVDQVLFEINVTPSLYDIAAILPTPLELHMTPSCWIAQMFQFWHGCMEFRFQFVCSKYHKGRVKIAYDPVTFGAGAATEDNLNFQQVVDLAETNDITVKVGWGGMTHWKPQDEVTQEIPPFRNGGVGVIPVAGDRTNGRLMVSVINDLTTPDTTAAHNIAVNVFARMCDDAEFSAPHGEFISNLTYFPQSTPEYDDSGVEDEEEENGQEPVSKTSLEINPAVPAPPCFMDVYPGEVATSVRQLLKRYSYHSSYGPTTNAPGYLRLILPNFPFFRGDPIGAVHTTAVPVGTWNFVGQTLFNYIVPAFAGWKGGIRWKYLKDSNFPGEDQATIWASRLGALGQVIVGNSYSVSYLTGGTGALSPTFAAAEGQNKRLPTNGPFLYNSTIDGVSVAKHSMGAVEVELPFYFTRRFLPARRQNRTSTQFLNGGAHYVNTQMNIDTDTYNKLNSYCSVGEDFSCFFFCGVPIQYLVTNPTP